MWKIHMTNIRSTFHPKPKKKKRKRAKNEMNKRLMKLKNMFN